MRNVLFSFAMAGALVMPACTDYESIAEEAGQKCIMSGDAPQVCYSMCSATFASESGYAVRACGHGVATARRAS